MASKRRMALRFPWIYLIGEPLAWLLSATEPFTKPSSSLPGSDLLLAPAVSVEDVAYAVVNATIEDDFFGGNQSEDMIC